jgi:hypothetical protein
VKEHPHLRQLLRLLKIFFMLIQLLILIFAHYCEMCEDSNQNSSRGNVVHSLSVFIHTIDESVSASWIFKFDQVLCSILTETKSNNCSRSLKFVLLFFCINCSWVKLPLGHNATPCSQDGVRLSRGQRWCAGVQRGNTGRISWNGLIRRDRWSDSGCRDVVGCVVLARHWPTRCSLGWVICRLKREVEWWINGKRLANDETRSRLVLFD